MTAFSWKKTQQKVLKSRAKRILQLEKVGKGQVAMLRKYQLKKLKRRIELQDTVKDTQVLRAELRKVA